MAFFEGKFYMSETELEEKYPVVVTSSLRMSEGRDRIVLINDFEPETSYYMLADPHAEWDRTDHVFFHTFSEEDATAAARTIMCLKEEGTLDPEEGVVLVRRDGEEIYQYAFGEIDWDYLPHQDDIRSLLRGEDYDTRLFFLPLKRHYFKCPICYKRTLLYSGYFHICDECGWEDDGTRGDENSSANDMSPSEYRREYIERKFVEPDYEWRIYNF